MPREQAIIAAWRNYFTSTAGASNGTTSPLDFILATILEVPIDSLSERDWYVATTVVQWLATNVGQCVLADAGYQRKPLEASQVP